MESESDDSFIQEKPKQRKISKSSWDNAQKETVKSLPIGINGLKKYEIKDFRQKFNGLEDGRKWKKNCPVEWKNHGRVLFADCKGSYKCVKEKCPFKIEFGVTNTTQFEKEGGEMICKGCGKVGEYVACSILVIIINQ